MNVIETARKIADNIPQFPVWISPHWVGIGCLDPAQKDLAVASVWIVKMNDGGRKLWIPLTDKGINLRTTIGDTPYNLKQGDWISLGKDPGQIKFAIANGVIKY
ncbi:MAG: hypothetical protein V1858_02300 [Candidatus Gottesmanbacteria bacterium]